LILFRFLFSLLFYIFFSLLISSFIAMPGSAVDVALRGAVTTGAAIRAVPAGALGDGFAAVLRFG